MPGWRSNKLIQLLVALAWRNVIILHDHRIDSDVLEALDGVHLSHVDYDITFASEEDVLDILGDMGHLYKTETNILLFCNVSMSWRVFRQIEEQDVQNPSTNLRHRVRLLVVRNDKFLVERIRTSIENLAVVSTSSAQRDGTLTIWTLLFRPEGRVYVPVKFDDVNKLNKHKVFPNIKYWYNGRKLVVVMKQLGYRSNLVTVGNNTVSSFSFRVLQALTTSLNFTYEIVFSEDGFYGQPKNGSWNGIVGMLHRKEADLAAVTLTIIKERTDVIDFILPQVIGSNYWATFKRGIEDTDDSFTVFARPFRDNFYLILLASVVSFWALLSVFRWMYPFRGPRKANLKCQRNTPRLIRLECCSNHTDVSYVSTVVQSFFDTYATIFKQSSSTTRHLSERFLIVSWWICNIIVSAVYCSSILAALTVEKNKMPFQDLTEMAENTDYKVAYAKGTAVTSIIEDSNDSGVVAVRKRVKDIFRHDQGVLSSDYSYQMKRVTEGRYVLITDHQKMLFMKSEFCDLDTMIFPIGINYQTFAVPKDSPYKEDLSKIMHKLDDSGILRKLRSEWFEIKPNPSCPHKQFPHPVSFTKFRSILVAVTCGLSLASLVFILEFV